MKKYKLKGSHMETLTPIRVAANPRGGANIQIFRESDVIELAGKVHPGGLPNLTSSNLPAAADDVYELAPKNGPRIMRTKAMKLYKVLSLCLSFQQSAHCTLYNVSS
jgi:hypothetical protein